MKRKAHSSRKTIQDKWIFRITAGCLIGFCLGYFLLEYVATWLDSPLGQTFPIVLGCTLIAVAIIVMAVAVRRRYFPKKKRRGSKPIFLDDIQKKKLQS